MGMHLFDDSRSPAYIYTKESYIPRNFKLIKNVNSYFNLNLAGKLNVEASKLIKEIDSAVIKGTSIITPYGVGSLEDLSTGCKAAICALMCTNSVINIDECGNNILPFVLKADAHLFATRLPYYEVDIPVMLNNQLCASYYDFEECWFNEKDRATI